MNDAERELIAGLFQRIRSVENARRDPDAEAYIADQVARQPYAPYAMAQTLVVQDRALEAARARIAALERDLTEARDGAERLTSDAPGRTVPSPWGPRAQETMARAESARSGEGFRQQPARSDGFSPPFGAPETGYRREDGYRQSYSPQGAPEPSRGGGFLSGALQTAAGVAAGALLFQGARSLFGGSDETNEAGEAAKAQGASEASDASSSDIGDWYSGLFGGSKADQGGGAGSGDDGDGGDGDWT